MALSRPERAYRYAVVATVASVLGGIAGWFLGHYAFESIARPILEFYGKLDSFEHLKNSVDYETIVLLLVTSGLAHLPPITVMHLGAVESAIFCDAVHVGNLLQLGAARTGLGSHRGGKGCHRRSKHGRADQDSR